MRTVWKQQAIKKYISHNLFKHEKQVQTCEICMYLMHTYGAMGSHPLQHGSIKVKGLAHGSLVMKSVRGFELVAFRGSEIFILWTFAL